MTRPPMTRDEAIREAERLLHVGANASSNSEQYIRLAEGYLRLAEALGRDE